MKVLIAGLAGASLGTEIVKCLSKNSEYEIFGCDISPLAYGLYNELLVKSFVVDNNTYIESIIQICKENGIKYIIPGGEQPMVILSKHNNELINNGIIIASNSAEIINIFSDKHRTFKFLGEHGFAIPQTLLVESANDLKGFNFPCIVKPSSGTGGSDSVFLATNADECLLYVELLHRNKRTVIVQEYIGLDEGEFTIGVLSDTNSNIIGSIAMQRVFNSKLSVAYRGQKGLISSGYSQGLISDFPGIRKQAEKMASAAKSCGPFNIQGRVRNGVLIPFEINPRFSASTYLRTLAGFNEVDLFLQHLVNKSTLPEWKLREGYYLRSFEEVYVPLNEEKK